MSNDRVKHGGHEHDSGVKCTRYFCIHRVLCVHETSNLETIVLVEISEPGPHENVGRVNLMYHETDDSLSVGKTIRSKRAHIFPTHPTLLTIFSLVNRHLLVPAIVIQTQKQKIETNYC